VPEIKLTEEENATRNLGFSLKEMTATKGWSEGFIGHVKDVSTHTWVDPREAKDRDDFIYKEIIGWAAAHSAMELIRWVENMISQAQAIEDKSNGVGPVDFSIG